MSPNIDEINAAVEEYKNGIARALTRSAIRAYIKGDTRAYTFMRTTPDMLAIQSSAQLYARQYSQDLIQNGGTMVWDAQQGKSVFKPWLKDSTEQMRTDIAKIIQDGLDQGKPTGTTERVKGGYSSNTIADDLSGYFDNRKSQASTIARTETGRIQNTGNLDRYSSRGYAKVKVLDDEGPHSCQACMDANGQEWTVEEAQDRILEHPNCVRDFAPVISDFPLKISIKTRKTEGIGCQAVKR